MLVVYILLGILLFLLLLLSLPVSFTVQSYDEMLVKMHILGFPITLVPAKEKPEKKPKKPKKTKEEESKKKKSSIGNYFKKKADAIKEQGISGIVDALQEIVAMVKTLSKRVIRSITIRKMQFHLFVGGQEASDVALNYGKLCATILPAFSLLEIVFKTKRNDILIKPSFTEETNAYTFDIVVWVIPILSIWACLCFFVKFMVFTKHIDDKKNPEELEEEKKNG